MGIDRRTLLISGAAVLGGIGVGVFAERQGWWTPAIIGTPDPNAALTRVARRTEAALIRAYDAALAAPALSVPTIDRLRAFRAQHLDHLAALGGGERDVERAPEPGRPDPAEPESSPALEALPADPAAWPAYFADAEQRRVGLLSTGVRISTDGQLGRLLALIAASETTHAIGWSRG